MDAATRRLVRSRAGDRCEYCLMPQDATPFLTFHVEHIVATQHVADDSISNLALACPDCNRHKGPNLSTIELETRELVRLFNPRHDTWLDHFRHNAELIEGVTKVGVVTARLLQMNSVERVEVRKELIDLGLYKIS